MPQLTISCVIYKPDILLLARTISSALASVDEAVCNYQFYVVDNSPPTNCITNKKFLDDRFNDQIIYLSGHGNVGYGQGHNLVIMDSSSDYHLILNPDVDLPVATIKNLISRMENSIDTALAFPSVLNGDSSVRYSCKSYPSVVVLLARYINHAWLNRLLTKQLDRYEYRMQIDSNESFQPKIVSGCFMFFRQEALRKLGGFDERFFLYFEDFDLSLRAAEYGKVEYCPDISIIHHGGGAGRKGWWHIKLFTVSMCRFFNKHGWKWW